MNHLQSWNLRTWGAVILLVAFLGGSSIWEDNWVVRIGALVLTALIAADANRRGSTQYLHPWLFFLLGLIGQGLMRLEVHTAITTGALIAAGVAILLVAPYKLSSDKPSRLHLLAAIIFAESVLLASLIAGTPVLQAAIAVIPLLLIEELMHRPRTERWKKAVPFVILTLILFIAIVARATYALP